MGAADFEDGAHVAWVAVEVDGEDGAGAGGDAALDVGGISVEGLRVPVGEDRDGVVEDDTEDGADVGGGGGDDFVAGFRVDCGDGGVDSAGAGGGGDGVLGAVEGGEGVGEGPHFEAGAPAVGCVVHDLHEVAAFFVAEDPLGAEGLAAQGFAAVNCQFCAGHGVVPFLSESEFAGFSWIFTITVVRIGWRCDSWWAGRGTGPGAWKGAG